MKVDSLKPGDVVFFKVGKRASKDDVSIQFDGHGFGIMLGHVPSGRMDPPQSHLLRLMGTVGFISFDDIARFFGEELGAECVKKFTQKYYPGAKVVPISAAKSSPLVDAKGKPIH